MAKVIMIQGTMSNAGKSLLAAGLCRIFKQDGYRVAPFKSQNMALNSFITEDGMEMGRAQVVQAEAAGIRPSVLMNPILLKPTTDVGSQVIVNGIPRGNMKAREYFAYKKQLVPEIMDAYRQLDEAYDIIVIEGAGSPAEINLKSEDIVNMGMAKLANAPVLLAGDIDRGGVFAQLYGTVMLLPDEERAMIKGMVINKFRGDKSILDSGVGMIEDLCGIPVVGVVPYMQVDIDDEDSLSEKLEVQKNKDNAALIDIAVIRLPRISNFTDFGPLSAMEAVNLRYVSALKELGAPDMVILPGTKNTIDDLLWLRQNGLEAVILKLAERQVPIWGICGGYQMLGEKLTDALGVESDSGKGCVPGMGLLPAATEFEEEKTRTRVTGSFGQVEGIFEGLSGMELSGYEIHMGTTRIDRPLGPADTCRIVDGRPQICRPMTYLMEHQGEGAAAKQVKTDGWSRGNIYGSYVHGIFDADGIAGTITGALLRKKGYDALAVKTMNYETYKEIQYDKLARGLRESLDMEKLYQILNAGISS